MAKSRHGASLRFGMFLAFLLILPLGLPQARADEAVLRLGLLKFGTVAWEIEEIRRLGLDKEAGLKIEVVDLATNDAGKIALMSGAVDAIVSDWLWVSRQRAEGARISFLPFSSSVGAVLVPRDSPIQGLADLRGKRLGVAGGPLDKSWLLIRALARRQGIDLAREAEIVFAAPPLLNGQIESGRLDAVLNFWHYAARLEAHGLRPIADVADAARGLGLDPGLPWIGYVVAEQWDQAHPGAVEAFFRASRQAKARLAASDEDWQALRPLMQAEDEASFAALRRLWRAGSPTAWGPAQMAAAEATFTLLGREAGADLTGGLDHIAPGTFRPGLSIGPRTDEAPHAEAARP